jgi:hypothetical protein
MASLPAFLKTSRFFGGRFPLPTEMGSLESKAKNC